MIESPLVKARCELTLALGDSELTSRVEALIDAKLGDTSKAHAPAEPTTVVSESPDYVPGGTNIGCPPGYARWLRHGDPPSTQREFWVAGELAIERLADKPTPPASPVAPAKPDSRLRPHIVAGKFQSDKYPTCPAGKVPLSVEDPMAQDLLWEYARRRQAVDAAFGDDLRFALHNAGYAHGRDSKKLTQDAYEALIAEDRAWLLAHAPSSLERSHIDCVLRCSVVEEYPSRGLLRQVRAIAEAHQTRPSNITPGTLKTLTASVYAELAEEGRDPHNGRLSFLNYTAIELLKMAGELHEIRDLIVPRSAR
jgi:hypothetical protein